MPVKLRSLHTRLVLALVLLLAVAGAFNLYSTLVTTELYLREVNQNMNRGLASNIASMMRHQLLSENGEVNEGGVAEILGWMMVVNPSAHFYILNLEGEILAYDEKGGEILKHRVDVDPILEFLEQRQLPARRFRTVLGEDPREPGSDKVFSAAEITHRGSTRHYLYIVLTGQYGDSTTERLRDSYILRLSTRNGLVYLAVALLAGWLVFGWLARPLRRLAGRMRELGSRDSDPDSRVAAPASDEVRLLEKTFEEMSCRIERQMAEIERMARGRHELIANVSHDLRTPIASLRGYLDTLALKDGVLSKVERDEYLQIAVRQSERLGRLVDELFELTKLDAKEVEPDMERFQLAELVQDNVQRFQLRAKEKGVTLEADFDPDLPPVRADLGLMERALENLIENALRFTPAGGAVRVELREGAHRLSVRVVDTGCGIAACDLPHIFDRYYRSRSGNGAAKKGAGLGLAITRRILELHHSELDIASTPGAGTTVAFCLAAEVRTHPLTVEDLPVSAAG